ncbi:hypothetical protein GmHk_02G004402 [Glycine max]|nr:hypothetical protein GmHk_02G004402 [Glycine max]
MEKPFTLLAEITSDGFNVWVLISFTESPWPTKLCSEEDIILLASGNSNKNSRLTTNTGHIQAELSMVDGSTQWKAKILPYKHAIVAAIAGLPSQIAYGS